MSYEAEAATIRAHFEQEWASFTETTPIAYENEPFTQPDGPWVRLAIVNAPAFQADMAPEPRYRHPGTVVVQVFTHDGTGNATARRLAEQAAGVFRGRTVGGIVFRAASVLPQGTDGTWYQVNAQADFFRDSTF